MISSPLVVNKNAVTEKLHLFTLYNYTSQCFSQFLEVLNELWHACHTNHVLKILMSYNQYFPEIRLT